MTERKNGTYIQLSRFKFLLFTHDCVPNLKPTLVSESSQFYYVYSMLRWKKFGVWSKGWWS